jgi:hypothetical protein
MLLCLVTWVISMSWSSPLLLLHNLNSRADQCPKEYFLWPLLSSSSRNKVLVQSWLSSREPLSSYGCDQSTIFKYFPMVSLADSGQDGRLKPLSSLIYLVKWIFEVMNTVKTLYTWQNLSFIVFYWSNWIKRTYNKLVYYMIPWLVRILLNPGEHSHDD